MSLNILSLKQGYLKKSNQETNLQSNRCSFICKFCKETLFSLIDSLPLMIFSCSCLASFLAFINAPMLKRRLLPDIMRLTNPQNLRRKSNNLKNKKSYDWIRMLMYMLAASILKINLHRRRKRKPQNSWKVKKLLQF